MCESPATNDRPPQGNTEVNDRPPQGQVSPLFRFHKLNDQGILKALAIANVFDKCLQSLQTMCPESREFSITKTKLEEASFFAKKAMANSPDNQDRPPQK